MQCKYCGENIQEGAAFCMNCGKAFDSQPVEQSIPTVQPEPIQQPVMQMQPMNNSTDNKKMYLIIAGIVVVAAIAIIIVLVMDNNSKKSSPASNNNSQSNISSNSNLNSNTNTNSNANTNSNSSTEEEEEEITVSGGEIEFNGYQFMIPINYEAKVYHWEYLGDNMTIRGKGNNFNEFDIEVEKTAYSTIKSDLVKLKEELSSNDYYLVGEFQLKTYGDKEYLVVSRSSKNTGYVHMIAYVALNDSETLVIDGTNLDFEVDYELISEVAPIIASAHK